MSKMADAMSLAANESRTAAIAFRSTASTTLPGWWTLSQPQQWARRRKL